MCGSQKLATDLGVRHDANKTRQRFSSGTISSFLNHVNPPAASVCVYAQWVIRFETAKFRHNPAFLQCVRYLVPIRGVPLNPCRQMIVGGKRSRF